jgi:hypothetical protein
MRILLTLLFLIVSSLGFGQQVNAPDPKEFIINTSAQNANGFSLSGFNSTDVLLCAIGLPVAPTGTTFYITTTTGLTASIGYTLTGNKTRLTFTGTQANINNALASLKVNTTGTAGNVQISVSATVNPTGYYYLPTNGHFYRPISTGVFYSQSKINAAATTFKGQRGYLVTITSSDEDNFIYNNVPQSNIWFALTDSITEGTWRIDDGPEKGTIVRIGTTNQQGVYNNWAGGEPNNWGGNEDYAVTKWNGSQWNDLNSNYNNPYVIEYGTWTNPDDQTFTEFYNNSVVNTNGPNLNLVGQFNFNFGGNVDETKFLGTIFKRNNSTSTWTGNTYKTLNGLGRVTLSEQLDTAKVFSSAISIATANDMTAYNETHIGNIYKMTITGNVGGTIWGTNIYTNDSYIPKAAVHAGVVTAGQTKEVYIKIVEGLNDYPATTQNGVTSDAWGAWGLSYQFVNEPSSYKANITVGQAEFSYVNISNGVTTLYIDLTRFGSTQPSTISKVKILDCYDGPVTYQQTSAYWVHYVVPSTLTKVTDGTSAFNSSIRNAGYDNWAFMSNISFEQNGSYKQHKFQFQDYDSVQLKTLYNSISDVYLAFKELAEAGGIFGGGSGTQFTYGMQFKNADIDDNGVFNEADCFRLLQNLTGAKNLVDNYTLDNTMKIILDSTYGTIGKSNWQQFPSFTGKDYGFSLLDGKINYTYNLAVSWKGDVNLSHSATPPSNGITTNSANFGMTTKNTNVPSAYIITQIIGDSLIATIKFTPNSNPIVGIQFQLNYDNSYISLTNTTYKGTGSPINFSNDRGSFINLGSLNTGGETLGQNTEYQLIFKIKKTLNNSLGLISISSNEAVDVNGKTSKIKIE